MSQLQPKSRERIEELELDETVVPGTYGELPWIHRIHRAFEDRRFRLFRRSVEPLAGGSGLEPLVQVGLVMLDGAGSLVEPAQLVAMAERCRLISSLDRWMVKTALRSLGALASAGRGEGGRGVTFCIPLSPQSLAEGGFLSFLLEELDRSSLDRRRVCFEIAEGGNGGRETLCRSVAVLRAEGCRFVYRGGSGGLAAFSLLRDLEVDFLKLHGELVAGLLVDPVKRILLDAGNRIGHLLGLATIAERVDNAELLRVVAHLGVDYAEGDCLNPRQPLVHEV
jgi:EAL domain-containing protein (putative c-di-GMP-specific phosphodiesterase class I)